MVYRYPPEVHEFVKKWAPKLRDKELAEACNKALGTHFTKSSMQSFRGNHGYRNGMRKHLTREEHLKHQTRFPQGMYEYIRDNSWGVSSAEMAERVEELFGYRMTPKNMKQYRQRYGIRSGVPGWYRKGRSPGNKGKKQSEYCSPEAVERSKRTQFKPGNVPHTWRPVGSVRIDRDGHALVKVQDEGTAWDRWKPARWLIWESYNGPVPKGSIVTFLNGNKLDLRVENLVVISRGEYCVMCRMGLWSEDPEITKAGIALVRLKIKANKVRKK